MRIERGARRVSADELALIAKRLAGAPGRLLGQPGQTNRLAPIVKEYIEKGNAPGGLIELAEDTNLVAALQITDDEFRTLASIALPASVDRDGYVQLLMMVRAITEG